MCTHTTGREPKRAHFRAPALQTPSKCNEKRHQEREEHENCGRRRKKSENFGGPSEGVRGRAVLGRGCLGKGGPGEGVSCRVKSRRLWGRRPPVRGVSGCFGVSVFFCLSLGVPPCGAPPFGAPPFWAPPFYAPPLLGSTPSRLHPSLRGLHLWGASQFGAPPSADALAKAVWPEQVAAVLSCEVLASTA